MKEEIVKVSSKGQIVLPAGVRDRLNIDKGRRLILVEKEGIIIMKPIKKLSEFKGIMKGSKLDTNRIIRDLRREWDVEL